jgi:import inner membrane translocase subunit TIM50
MLIIAIAYYNVQDVRPTLKHYQGKDIAKEYAMIEEEQKKKAVEDWERTHASAVTGAGSGFLTSMFGSVGSVSCHHHP